MIYKPDWTEAQRRLTALWHGERLDRPCVAIMAPQLTDVDIQFPEINDVESQWLDPAYRVAITHLNMERTWWGGEAIPSSLLMAGWMICLGGTPLFAKDTIWFETRTVDFTQPSPFRHNPDSIWMQKYRTLLIELCKFAGKDDFLIGSPLGLPANDLISMHMGTEEFMYALEDHPEWMIDAICTGAYDQRRTSKELQVMMIEMGHDFWYGNAGWMPFWAPEPYIPTQSDVSCMLSPATFDRFILPELEIYGEEYNALWYHLDGGDAKQHLPRLLSLPFMKVIQYVPAPFEQANGPAHLEMYRHIQEAGKIVHIQLPAENIEPLVRELNPALLMLETWCQSHDEGEKLLEQITDWCA
ncbi:MAG: hypothetical protein WCO98_13070 [bacterium]